MRRGEIGIGVIVIIALGLIVLLVLSVLLATQVGNANKTLAACSSTYRGTCMVSEACQASGGRVYPGTDCSEATSQSTPRGWGIISFPEGGSVCCVS